MNFPPFEHNPIVSGGFVLMILGGVLYYFKRLPWLIYDFIERFFIVKLEILDEDEAYQWMQLWLAERLHRTLSMSVMTKRSQPRIVNEDEPCPARGKPTVHLVPGVGTYFFWYRGRLVILDRNRWENPASIISASAGSQNPTHHKESFTLRIFSRNKDLVRQLVEECRQKAIPDDDRIDILVANYGCWSLGTRVKPRSLGSVILDGDQAGQLLADMKAFLAGADWYRNIGIPYRRGYLLHGPPGNGKTSIVKAVASELNMNIYLLMLSDPDMNDNRINDLLAKVPEKSILLLEDIDCAFTRRKRTNGKEGGLTFSGLLNAIDGIASAEGRIIVMTTNHLDRLDPALIRPGRADVKLSIGNATADQARRLFERFFPNHGHLAGVFVELIEDGRHSMAALQDYLMLHRDDAEGAVEEAHEIDRSRTSNPQAQRNECLLVVRQEKRVLDPV
jgi:chaperone BCS1